MPPEDRPPSIVTLIQLLETCHDNGIDPYPVLASELRQIGYVVVRAPITDAWDVP